MKVIALLLLLAVTVTLGVAIDWQDPVETQPDQAQRVAPVRAPSPAPTQTSVRLPDPRPSPVATIRRLPPSFAGTQVDGQLRTDASGRLIIENDIRRVFDYFLASIGEESLEASVTRLRHYIEAQLPQPGEGQALQLLAQYLDYKRQLLLLEQDHVQQADLNAMRERLQAVRQLRAQLFDDEVHQAFFALDETADSFTLERLAIRRDSTLDAAAKGAAIDRLQSSLPPELQDAMVIQLQSELREQTRALQARGATPADLRRLRQQLVGNAATARLERLDLKRQEWQRRLSSYQKEKSRIESSRGLGEADKRAAIARLAAERFDENERQRLEAVEQLLVIKQS
ncbi:lipase secretion chaperone [Pseudomonas sp. KSR10]|uniref:lipase secretion chaperone n=1 Tax=Pseudomonas sp. KSR10 TaxID=2916654 RepID=UPI001EF9AFDB|nr:lipase secretion chaperone [Pseudomonas sp. KSR10]MCG6542565.1 lipase secretion chaperone [Pseudomonas sp. KSR10]